MLHHMKSVLTAEPRFALSRTIQRYIMLFRVRTNYRALWHAPVLFFLVLHIQLCYNVVVTLKGG